MGSGWGTAMQTIKHEPSSDLTDDFVPYITEKINVYYEGKKAHSLIGWCRARTGPGAIREDCIATGPLGWIESEIAQYPKPI